MWSGARAGPDMGETSQTSWYGGQHATQTMRQSCSFRESWRRFRCSFFKGKREAVADALNIRSQARVFLLPLIISVLEYPHSACLNSSVTYKRALATLSCILHALFPLLLPSWGFSLLLQCAPSFPPFPFQARGRRKGKKSASAQRKKILRPIQTRVG